MNRLIIKNLNSQLLNKDIHNLKDAATFLNMNYSTLRCWFSLNRTVSLKKLDNLCNIIGIPTYFLFSNTTSEIDLDDIKTHLPNDTLKILSHNLDNIYKDRRKFSWNERESLFYGMIGKDSLIAYRRKVNNRYPKISTIEIMCSYLGIPATQLLKGGSYEN